MEYFGYCMAILALSIATGALCRISSLERKMRVLSNNPVDYISLLNILKENIGKEVKLEFFETIHVLLGHKLFVKDLDDSWILLTIKEKKEEKDILVRLDNIKNITLK